MMRAFCLNICLAVAAVMARPEPPLYVGVQQQNQKVLHLNAHNINPHIYQQLPQEHSFANFDTSALFYGAPDASSLSSSSDILNVETFRKTPAEMSFQEDSYDAAYRHSYAQHQTGYDNGPIETKVHKHIYVHVPPKDFEEENTIQPRVIHQNGPVQKHYKIVFIKAPTVPTLYAPVVPPVPQNEEKTLIYILHKKPEVHKDIVIPTPAPIKPSKPEVYFIKYKTKKEEAPVYGPPLATDDIRPRQATDAAANGNNDFSLKDLGQYEIFTTTQQPILEKEQVQQQHQAQHQLSADKKPLVVGVESPIATNFVNNEVSPISAVEPLSQYLAPETAPALVMVDEPKEPAHVPAAKYEVPSHNRYFAKKRK